MFHGVVSWRCFTESCIRVCSLLLHFVLNLFYSCFHDVHSQLKLVLLNSEFVQLMCPTLLSLRKIYQNTSFLWPFYSRIKIVSTIQFLYGKNRGVENPYFSIFYAVFSKSIDQIIRYTIYTQYYFFINNFYVALLWLFSFIDY